MLQKILLAIDFSANSATLVEFAFAFNKYFFAELHLIHVFTLPYALTQETDEALAQYETIRNSYTEKLWAFINQFKGDYHFDTIVHTTTGGESQSIIDYATKHHIDLVIIGNKERGRWGRWLSGSITQQLLQKPPAHVLSIPTDYVFKEWKQLWAATDLAIPITDAQAYFLKYLMERLNANLDFLHISDQTEKTLEIDQASKHMIYMSFQKEPIILPIIDSIAHTIDEVIHKKGGDLLIVFPHHHNWLDAFFLGHETAAISKEISIPLLAMKGMER